MKDSAIEIWPSILTADFAGLKEVTQAIKSAGCDGVHLDIMDGHFVPNLTFGPPVVKKLRAITDLTFDAHLMVEYPSDMIDDFADAGVAYLSIHAEADIHLYRTLTKIRSAGMKPGVALNPATPINTIIECMPWVDFILVMTVEPGFGGQKFIPEMLDKIRQLRTIIDSNERDIKIQVDGGINIKTAPSVVDAGASMLVSGSAFFNAQDKSAFVDTLRQKI